MNRCKKCNYPYRYEDMFRASWQLFTDVKVPCPKCAHTHYISEKQIAKIYLHLFVVNLIIMMAVNIFHLHSYVLLTLYIVSLVLLIIFFPLLHRITEYPDGFLRKSIQ